MTALFLLFSHNHFFLRIVAKAMIDIANATILMHNDTVCIILVAEV